MFLLSVHAFSLLEEKNGVTAGSNQKGGIIKEPDVCRKWKNLKWKAMIPKGKKAKVINLTIYQRE